MQKQETVYLSGKMSGTPDMGREQFNRAEQEFRAMGYRVLNPAILPTDLEPTAYIPICLAMLEQANAVIMLEGWEDSDGAKLEAEYAKRIGKPVYVATLENEHIIAKFSDFFSESTDETAEKWIKCADRLPDTMDEVWVCLNSDEVMKDGFNPQEVGIDMSCVYSNGRRIVYKSNGWYKYSNDAELFPMYWMPIEKPKKPNGADENE